MMGRMKKQPFPALLMHWCGAVGPTEIQVEMQQGIRLNYRPFAEFGYSCCCGAATNTLITGSAARPVGAVCVDLLNTHLWQL